MHFARLLECSGTATKSAKRQIPFEPDRVKKLLLAVVAKRLALSELIDSPSAKPNSLIAKTLAIVARTNSVVARINSLVAKTLALVARVNSLVARGRQWSPE
ncbi:MAG: hypothetical protein ABL962_08075 [Fimbriimonadaceae bacterium]